MPKTHNVLRGSYRNILAVYIRASNAARSEGEDWYAEAWNLAHDLANETGLPAENCAGVIAVLSPTLDWDTNVQAARDFIRDGYTRFQTRINNDKAQRALWGDHSAITGPKVRAFWQAICDPYGDTPPVVDRHAVAIYCGRPVSDVERRPLARKGVLDRIQSAYRRVAKITNQPVHVVQAVTWVQWRYEQYGTLTED